MTESTQILLFAVVIVLTILMVIIGWQIFQILSEIRKMLMKFNSVADEAVTLTGNIGKSVQNLSGFSDGLKTAFSIFHIFKKKKSRPKDDQPLAEKEEEKECE